MESNHVAGEPANAVRGPVLDVVNDLGPARRPEMSGMFTARCCNVSLGWVVTIALFSASHLMADGAITEAQALERFLGQTSLVRRDSSAFELDIEASLSKLHKSAKLRTLQFVSGMGRSVFRTLDSEGDAMVRREVIARYLKVEAERQEAPAPTVAISPANYRFVFRGATDYAGQAAYVYRLEPKRKRAGLFKGELWLDAETGSVLREWGEFVKSPSWFVKSVYFVRDYMMQGRQSRTSEPRRLILNVSTRLFGRADVTIWFDKAPDALRNRALDSPDAALNKNGRPQVEAGQ
jgi:hypothetical protein